MERKFEVTENALWKRRGKAIVSKNLNRWRRCPRLASVLREMNRCVVEYHTRQLQFLKAPICMVFRIRKC